MEEEGGGGGEPSFSKSLLAGGIAGTSVDLALYPLDTIKTRLQAKGGFMRSGGFSGVYRGIGSVVVGSAPGAALFFTTYEQLKSRLRDSSIFSGPDRASALHMVAASGGEFAACLIRVPTEVVKQRQQASIYGNTSSSLAALRFVIAESGIPGLYRGFFTTVAREIPFSCIQFPLYERLKLSLSRYRGLPDGVASLPAWPDSALCGSLAGGVAAGLTTPLDVAKTRIMLSRKSSSEAGHYTSTLTTLRRVYSEEGARALFRGVSPRVMWLSVGGAVFLGVYETAKRALVQLDRKET